MQPLIFRTFSITVQEAAARAMNYAELWQKHRPVPFQDIMQKVSEDRTKGVWQSKEKNKSMFQSKEKTQRINLEQEQPSVFSFATLWDYESKINQDIFYYPSNSELTYIYF